jgi:TRAP transporter 4TM/12TM fusion protein
MITEGGKFVAQNTGGHEPLDEQLDEQEMLRKAQIDAEAVLRKYDSESNTRTLTGFMARLVSAIAITFSLFQLYTAIFGVMDAHLQRAVHLSFGMALIFLLYPSRASWSKTSVHPFDILLAIVGAALPLYVVANYGELVLRSGQIVPADMFVGTLGILMVIEGARRAVGWPIVIVAVLFITYGFAGPYMPDILAHRGLDVGDVVSHLYFTTEGVFGIPLGVSSTFIFLFILFGAYLETTGLGKFFIDIANALAGWAAGGPAKVAVLSSGLMGMVSGSSVGNVVGTGSFTIPMMKKMGYSKEFAGAVEATASTGGQLMPPIMGAAAFLMAEFMGVPYIEVVKAAAIPAVLYFTGIWIGVHLEAKKNGLQGVPRDQLPKFKELFFERGHLALPLVGIVYLLVAGYSPNRAALAAILLAIVASFLRKSTRMKPIEIIQGLEKGAKGVLGVMIACASAGIIIGIVTKTGVGLKLAGALIDLAGGMLLPAMFFTMITSIILGMGVPTTANYVITSTIAAPALIQMGVPLMAAHMFVFYFGIIADVTPPVALAAFAGAGISGGNPMKTGITASKLAIAAFVIPYIFVLSPALLMVNTTPVELIWAFATSVIGMVGLGTAMIGYLMAPANIFVRIMAFAGGITLIYPGVYTDMIGFGMLGLVLFIQIAKRKRQDAKAKLAQ